MALQRRRLLTLAAAGSGALAGCIEDLPGRTADGDGNGDGDGDPDVELRCPDYDRQGVERVVCSADPPGDSLVFEPDPERVELPRAEIPCRLENDSGSAFSTNFYNWSLHRHRDGEWHHLGPYAVPQPLHTLSAGETHVRRFLVDNTDLERVRPPDVETADGEYGAARHGLGPGAYAIAITSDSEGPETAYAAAFVLEGDPVPLVAPETVVGTERDGDSVAVDVDSTSPDHDLDRYDLTVRREPDPPREPEPMIDEQLYHPNFAGLRAAFVAFEDDLEAVEVRGDDSQFVRHATSGSTPDFLDYGGDSFRLEVDPRDD